MLFTYTDEDDNEEGLFPVHRFIIVGVYHI